MATQSRSYNLIPGTNFDSEQIVDSGALGCQPALLSGLLQELGMEPVLQWAAPC